MKTRFILRNIFFSLLFLPIIGVGQNKEEAKKKTMELFEVIETKNIKFVANDMNTATLGFNAITSDPNTVVVKNDSIFIDLPFWGRAYQADFKYEGGFHSKTEITSKEKKLNKRKSLITYYIRTKTETDNLRLVFYVSNSEYASLKIISNQKESIDYTGTISYQ